MKRILPFVGTFVALVLFAGLLGSYALEQEDDKVTILSPGVPVELVEQFGGASYAVSGKQNLTFLGVGPRLVALNTTDTSAIVFTGQSEVLKGVVQEFVLSDPYAYIVTGLGGFYVVDISIPTGLRILAHIEVDGFLSDVVLHDKYAVIAGSPYWDGDRWTESYLIIIDISQPGVPQVVADIAIPGWVNRMVLAENRVFIAAGDAGVQIVDVSKPSTPVLAGAFPTSGYAVDVERQASHLYVANHTTGIQVVDISDPARPLDSGYEDSVFGTSKSLEIAEDRLYVTNAQVGLRILDISEPGRPRNEVDVGMEGDLRDIFVTKAHVYLADRENGLHVLAANDDGALDIVGRYDALGYVDGVDAYTDKMGINVIIVASGGDLRVARLTSDGIPEVTDFVETVGNARDVVVIRQPGEHFVAVADGPAWRNNQWTESGVQIFRLLDDRRLQEVAFWQTAGEAHKLSIDGNTIYLAGGSSGLRLLDVSQPEKPQEMGYFVTQGSIRDVTTAEPGCVNVTEDKGLYYICIGKDDGNPQGSTSVAIPTPAPSQNQRAPETRGVQAYSRVHTVNRVLAADEDTLFYTEPEMTDPMLGGNRNKANALRSGSREIVADRDKQAGVEIVNTAGEIRALTKIGNDYYIADGDGGLVIYHIGNGSN